MEQFSSKEEYLSTVRDRSLLPEGFNAASTAFTFYPQERKVEEPLPMNLSVILLDEPSEVFAGMFTRNSFPGAPVLWDTARMEAGRTRGVIINNKIANVCVSSGIEDCRTLAEHTAQTLGGTADQYFLASTGIIGWRLPVEEMKAAVPDLAAELSASKEQRSIYSTAQGMMTTDRFPKVRTAVLGKGRIVGVAKGAGMIEPNMGTMLVFLLTDVAIDRTRLRALFPEIIEESFNRITVDGDQSTSDTALMFSSGKKPSVSEQEFRGALSSVCRQLADDIVRNGEGTTHVIRVRVHSAPDRETAVGTGKAIVNSPLVKTAIFGNDPNVGRIVSALGDYWGSRAAACESREVDMRLGGETIFTKGAFTLDQEKEERLRDYLEACSLGDGRTPFPAHKKSVEIEIDMKTGAWSEEVVGSDLTYDYIRENADYRS